MIEIRAARDSDGPALEAVYRKCRADSTWLPASARSLCDFREDTKGEAILVATIGGDPVGFIAVWEPESFVHHLYVREDVRDGGIGTALLDALNGRVPFPWRLKCLLANTAAHGFYRKRGWNVVSSGEGPDGPFALMEKAGP